MNLRKKKNLAVKTLGVGRDRISFNTQRLDEIKEAITKQDIRDLVNSKAILINEIRGSKSKVKRRTRRRAGSIKKTVGNRKRKYVILTRKLRAYAAELRKHGLVDRQKYLILRKEIKSKIFRSKAHLKERIASIK